MATRLIFCVQKIEEIKKSVSNIKLMNVMMAKLCEFKIYIKIKSTLEQSSVPCQLIWQDRVSEENTIYFNDSLLSLLDFDVRSISKMWVLNPFVDFIHYEDGLEIEKEVFSAVLKFQYTSHVIRKRVRLATRTGKVLY